MEPKRIVCGVTASTRSQRAVLDAARLAQRTGARLFCVHVVDASFFQEKIADPLSRAFIESSLIHLGIQIVDHASQIAKTEGVMVEKHLVKGCVRKCLHKMARELGADLLVLGGDDGRTVFRDVLKPAGIDDLLLDPVPRSLCEDPDRQAS
ncbi:MAG: universal stress protein [Syntrophobacteraceae bacterium]|jgi:nucleotide-binding universal stress UspA family protein|nr:universal stress protein [Syntrophobacteraceae bacterium]